MIELLLVFLAGGIGSITRLGIARWIGFTDSGFPLATLVVNLVACVILGFVGGLLVGKVNVSPAVKSGIAVGFCGGFSTFSTFSNETLGLFMDNKPVFGLLYVLASVVLCVIGLWLGQLLGKMLT